jgi:hypothetical protein
VVILFLISPLVIPDNHQTNLSEDQNDDLEYALDNKMITNSNQFLSNAPTTFTENRGQLYNDNVRFYAQDGSVWFTDSGVWFELREYYNARGKGSDLRGQESPTHILPNPHTPKLTHSQTHTPTLKYKSVILKQEFVGTNQVQPIGKDKLSWNSNFFYGNDSEKWCSDVPNYAEVFYENIYDGIDLKYYSNNNGLKYDLIVHPGADYNQIRIKYIGAQELNVDKFGNLKIKTEIDTIMDGNLFIYQNNDEYNSGIEAEFRIYGNMTYGFDILGDYQRDEILIIDPLVQLKYSTYIGGSNNEEGIDIMADNTGNSFVTGWASSSNFPTTPGAYDTSINGGFFGDIFVLKFDQNGSAPIYSTFIGGNGNDIGIGIVIDPAGNAYVAGQTDSSNFPFTQGAFDTSFNGTHDAVILKLNSTGSALIYSTFIGGNQWEVGFDIAIDATGNVFVTGSTSSANFPTTPNAFDTIISDLDCFVVKLDQNGTSLIYSTLVGGSGMEEGYGIVYDSKGNITITGITRSSDFPTSSNAHDRIYSGNGDAFVFKLNWNGTQLLYSTFVGRRSTDIGWAITMDPQGNAFVTGKTDSKNFPTTGKVYDSSYNGNGDVFVSKLNPNGTKLLFSTFVGGSNNEGGNSIALDPLGNVLVAGTTFSSNFPTTIEAMDRTFNGTSDHFMLKLNQSGSILQYSSFIGGIGDEHNSFDAYFVRGRATINEKGYVFFTGETNSTDLLTTAGVHDSSYNGKMDVFVNKFFILPTFEINSLKLLQDTEPVTTVYSKYIDYTFRISITDTSMPSKLQNVQLYLNPLNTDLQFSWNKETGSFSEIKNTYDHVHLESSSSAYKESWYEWIIDFNITFDWTYPDEELHDVQVFATNALTQPKWLNSTDIYQVENDLVFNGNLLVKGEYDRIIEEYSIVRGGEELHWTGVIPVYEGTQDIYPPLDEVDITIWDELHNSWIDSPEVGQPLDIKTTTPEITRTNGFNFTINLTGIPRENDHTNNTFSIRLDRDNITFKNPKPEAKEWQRTSNVNVGVTIKDIGGADVNGSSIYYCISDDNGTNWGAWEHISNVISRQKIIVQNSVAFKDGKDNLIQWRASDTVGNGPTESEPNRVLVDTKNVTFSNSWPDENDESATEEVTVGITIFDLTSGVDASKISYSVSYNGGETWYYWKPVNGFKNGHFVNVTLNLTFPNGTDNRIMWQAYDIAGNGPIVSDEYIVKVNISKPKVIPEVVLLAPINNSMVSSSSIELSWMLNNTNLKGVVYDIFLDTVNPPLTINRSGLDDTTDTINGLLNGETYYWIVIPRIDKNKGFCLSGVWSFTVDLPAPAVVLDSPKNDSIIGSPRPTFVWFVEYNGTRTLSYDVYLGLDQNPTELSLSNTTNYLPNENLEDGKTYYWKVVPWAGDLEGPESEIWSFTVNYYHIPEIALNLTLDPSEIKQAPGDQTQVRAIVTNIGNLADNITVNISVPAGLDINAIVSEPITLNILPLGSAEFNITVITEKDIENREIDLIVIATSGRAEEYGFTYEKEELLKVIILNKDAPVPEKASETTQIWIIVAVLIVIFMAIVILLFLNQKRKSPTTKVTTPIKSQGSNTPEQANEKESPAIPKNGTTSPNIKTTQRQPVIHNIQPTLATESSTDQAQKLEKQ